MKMKIKKHDNDILDSMSRNPDNWKGILYFNRKDKRLVVPKLYPLMGWTFNFACPYAYLLVAAIILLVIVFQYIA
jgi:uncharacterized membrane protein